MVYAALLLLIIVGALITYKTTASCWLFYLVILMVNL